MLFNKIQIMKKIIAATFLITSMFLTGCAGNQENQIPQQPTKTIQENNIFEHELFSLKLPAPYIADASGIQPKDKKDFPIIIFGNSKEKVEINKLLEFTEEWFAFLWTQTGPSGKFISNENITIDGKNGIKFTIQYPGRDYEDSNGYLNEYHYSIINGENLFQFWTSASDLESPEEVSKSFNKIIGTISFK